MKKILTLFLSLFITFTITNICFARDIKFAQVTDVYFRNNSANLSKIIKDINKNSDIDFVLFTGNNIGKANIDNLESFLKALKKLNKPYYLVLGNKDVSKSHNLEKSTYLKTVRKYNKRHPKSPNYVFKKGDIVFLVVDGSKELIPSVNGFYSQDTIKWVDKQLTKYNTNKVIIAQHFPLMNKPNNEYYTTYNILEYMQMLSKHSNVIAVISGHYNQNDEITYNGVYHITTPRASDGYYKIIDIEMTNGPSIYTVLKDIRQ